MIRRMRICVDSSRRLRDEPGSGHNRWHPDLEPLVSVAPGVELTLECRDGLDGQFTRVTTHADVLRMERGAGHPLTGPVLVEGARPGDLLEVELLGYEPAGYGFSAVIPGFGFLADVFDEPFVLGWELADGLARSEHLPGVAVPADIFAGNAGVAPSHELLERQRRREQALAAAGGAVAADLPEEAVPAAAAPGVRTIPPRENGGNLDVRGLVSGAKLYLPVFVEGALFSIGDLHYAQGDGECSGTGIEMAGAATIRFQVHTQPAWRPQFPAYETPARTAGRTFATTGVAVRPDGTNADMDLTVAARAALLAMIDWLVAEKGLERYPAYLLCGAAVDLRLSEVVDVPNPVVSAVCPLDIFES
jgi:formamidase